MCIPFWYHCGFLYLTNRKYEGFDIVQAKVMNIYIRCIRFYFCKSTSIIITARYGFENAWTYLPYYISLLSYYISLRLNHQYQWISFLIIPLLIKVRSRLWHPPPPRLKSTTPTAGTNSYMVFWMFVIILTSCNRSVPILGMRFVITRMFNFPKT